MTIAELIAAAEAIARSGFAALMLTILVAVWQTVELRRCRARDAACGERLTTLSVALARVYGVMRERLGQHEEIPTLAELMADRRDPSTTP